MTAEVQLQEPLVLGDRRIYPVVAGTFTDFGKGMAGTIIPLALIIEEEGRFSIALLEIDSVMALLEKLGAAYAGPLL